MDDSGNLWVAEAGTGGDQTITVGDQTIKVGNTGQITRVAPDGTKSVVVSGLISGASQDGEVSGPSGVIYANGALWITGIFMGTTPGAPSFGILKADPATGAVNPVADLSAFEASHNPDGFAIDSNPYGLALGPDGMLYVADAAGNDLLKVDPATGEVSLVAVFGGIPLPAGPETANPTRGGANESDPVPTGVSIAEDGHAFVGFLTGFPFLEGAAKVVHVSEDGHVSDAVTGLTMVVDVEVDVNDNIYASEFGRFSLTSTPPGFAPGSGQVVSNSVNGTTTVIAGGLNEPNGIALDENADNIYVVVNSNSPAGTGQIMRFGTTGAPGVVGMPVTGSSSPPLEALLTGLLLVASGVLLRVRQAHRTSL
jgi:hypothetical protein